MRVKHRTEDNEMIVSEFTDAIYSEERHTLYFIDNKDCEFQCEEKINEKTANLILSTLLEKDYVDLSEYKFFMEIL